MSVSFSTFYPSCTFSICTAAIKMGLRAPLLLSEPIPINLPSMISSLFPICASIAVPTPAIGKLVAESDTPMSMTLGASMILSNSVAVPTATAIFSAGANVFESDSEVRQLIFESAFIDDINNLLTCFSRLLLVPEFAANLVLQELRSAFRLHFQMEPL
jgi:hypothetical protein